jgi:hypothetical protein
MDGTDSASLLAAAKEALTRAREQGPGSIGESAGNAKPAGGQGA